MKIGFIGLGNMGAAIAANLVRAHHDVLVWNRSADKAAPLIEAGAASLDSRCVTRYIVTRYAIGE